MKIVDSISRFVTKIVETSTKYFSEKGNIFSNRPRDICVSVEILQLIYIEET